MFAAVFELEILLPAKLAAQLDLPVFQRHALGFVQTGVLGLFAPGFGQVLVGAGFRPVCFSWGFGSCRLVAACLDRWAFGLGPLVLGLAPGLLRSPLHARSPFAFGRTP